MPKDSSTLPHLQVILVLLATAQFFYNELLLLCPSSKIPLWVLSNVSGESHSSPVTFYLKQPSLIKESVHGSAHCRHRGEPIA